MSKIKPYQDQKKDGYIIREFKSSISERRLMWHRDKCDRIIEPIHTTDWKFQYDNQVPIPLSKLFIPKETYHRIIKGTGDLTLKIKELWIVIVKYVHVKSAIVTAAVAVN